MGSYSSPGRLWNRNFILLWQGQFVSSIGKQMFAIAAMLWLKSITDSGTLMGLVMTVAIGPMVVLGPISGVLVDRWDRRRLIAWADILGGLAVTSAAVLFFAVPGRASLLIGTVFGVTLTTGLLDTISQPAISASLPLLSPPKKLEAANGFNMAGIQTAVFIAQGLAGFLFVLTGMSLLVIINAGTYLYAGFTELFMRIPVSIPIPADPDRNPAALPGEPSHPRQRFIKELKEGFWFVYRNRGMRAGLILNMALNFFISPILVLLPFFVEDHIGLPPEWYGYFMAAFGVGGLFGFILAGAFPTRGKAREIIVSSSLVAQTAQAPGQGSKSVEHGGHRGYASRDGACRHYLRQYREKRRPDVRGIRLAKSVLTPVHFSPKIKIMADSLALVFDSRYHDRGTATLDSWKEEAILQAIALIHEAFVACFDNQVSAVIINELPTDFKTLRYIRNLLTIRRIDGQALITIEMGLTELEQFLKIVNTYFLPRAKELMHVSHLKPEHMVTGKDLYVLRKLALTVLPENLKRLTRLTSELKNIMILAA